MISSVLIMTVTMTAPVFGPCEPFIFNGEPLDTGMGAAPSFVDWNGDGLTDLLLGTRSVYGTFTGPDGPIIYMPNSGNLTNPVFDSWTLLEADGNVITHNS